MLNHAERIEFANKIYPIAKQLVEHPKSAASIAPILLTKSEYAHAEYLQFNMRYFTKQRVKRAA